MGVIIRPDSRFFWIWLERAGLPPIRESTKVLCRGVSPAILRENRALAEAIYSTRMGDLARQRHGLKVERHVVTFRTWAEWYLTHVTPTKRTDGREANVIQRLVAFFGRQRLDQIDQDLVREWTTHRRRSVQASTVNRELDVLKSMLTSAVPKHLAVSPLAGMKRLRAVSHATAILTHEQEAALLKVMTPEEQAVLLIALDALLRRADLSRLRWTHDHGTYLQIVDPKVAPYRVPVSARLRAALDGLERTSPYVFGFLRKPRPGRPYPATISTMFEDACRRANVPHGRPEGVTFHSLRHTGATRAMDAGASLRDLMALGGWRDLKSVLRYTRPTQVDQQLVDRMSTARKTI